MNRHTQIDDHIPNDYKIGNGMGDGDNGEAGAGDTGYDYGSGWGNGGDLPDWDMSGDSSRFEIQIQLAPSDPDEWVCWDAEQELG